MTKPWHWVGHRGAPREFPANTMRSFQRAVELGCTMLECDVQRAADGALVLAHDPDVTDASGRKVVIAEHPSEVLRGLDLGAGEGLPTLAELAAWTRGRCVLMADMKCEGGDIEPKVIEALSILPDEAKIVTGAREESRRRFRELAPGLTLSFTLSDAYAHLLEHAPFETFLAAMDTQAVTWEHPLLNAERIVALHARSLDIYAWTVDDLPTMRRLKDEGVDGIITNRPDLLHSL